MVAAGIVAETAVNILKSTPFPKATVIVAVALLSAPKSVKKKAA